MPSTAMRPSARREPPVAADDATEEPRVREMVHPAALPVALARRVDEGEVPRLPVPHEPAFDRGRERLGMGRADEAARRDGLAVGDQGSGFLRRAHGRGARGLITHQPPLAWMTWPVT